jgi:type II restriction/modification system DNA methylase subunit YeeA
LLHALLENAEKDGDHDIVSWLEDGNSFRINEPGEFCEKIMKNYFKQTKFSSFSRQVCDLEGSSSS